MCCQTDRCTTYGIHFLTSVPLDVVLDHPSRRVFIAARRLILSLTSYLARLSLLSNCERAKIRGKEWSSLDTARCRITVRNWAAFSRTAEMNNNGAKERVQALYRFFHRCCRPLRGSLVWTMADSYMHLIVLLFLLFSVV